MAKHTINMLDGKYLSRESSGKAIVCYAVSALGPAVSAAASRQHSHKRAMYARVRE
ncbi:hypothetical protein P8936_10990 [Edaphobacter paludis]|uniref:Uncharacterized protein n=1 Tax=Edaphobacter paludis TaxID=3035702 RepID=A0AAU7D575_9BACT